NHRKEFHPTKVTLRILDNAGNAVAVELKPTEDHFVYPTCDRRGIRSRTELDQHYDNQSRIAKKIKDFPSNKPPPKPRAIRSTLAAMAGVATQGIMVQGNWSSPKMFALKTHIKQGYGDNGLRYATKEALQTSKAKNLWDTFKLARFGKAFVIDRNDSAPLVQIIGSFGTYMTLYLKVRGVMILEEAGTFVVPTYKAMVPSLLLPRTKLLGLA
ncbi:hypothetical protein BGX27_004745, partial [Mortierella sp. AM989]